MTLGFYNLALLLGLAGLVVPVLIHLLTRRRHEVVEWGAMQFLRQPTRRRTRRTFDEFWLLLTRMLLLGLIVAALAAPFLTGAWIAAWTRPPRDVVLILDVSASMDVRVPGKPTPWEQAKEKAREVLKELHTDDRAALILATNPPISLTTGWSQDFAELTRLLEEVAEPRGSADGPEAIQEAWKHFKEQPRSAAQQVWVASDFQEWGWMDEATQARWSALAHQLASETAVLKKQAGYEPAKLKTEWIKPGFGAALPPNFALGPLKLTRSFSGIGQRIALTSQLHIERHEDTPFPKAARVLVDGRETSVIPLSPKKEKSLPISFDLRFNEPGLHRVRLELEAPAGYWDCLPGDNRQEMVLEVAPELPVLLVEGSGEASLRESRGSTFFLSKAFADPAEPKKVSLVVPRVVTAEKFDVERDLKEGAKPRVVILADVPHLRDEQWDSLEKYVDAGGGLWVILGPRAAEGREPYNARGYRQGKGLLPAGLTQIKKGDEVFLDGRRWLHPSLEIFKASSLSQVPVRTWWSIEPAPGSTAWALLTTGEPWLVSKSHGKGRVLLSALPMDRSWESMLAPAWEFPVLVHELVFALAEARGSSFNVEEGKPLILAGDRLPGWDPATPLPVAVSWTGFAGSAQKHVVASWPAVLPSPGPAGMYSLQVGSSMTVPIAVERDARESDLSYASAEQWKKIADALPFVEEATSGNDAGAPSAFDAWWLIFLIVLLLLGVESWLSGRLVKARGLT